jgi:hypothetical protein
VTTDLILDLVPDDERAILQKRTIQRWDRKRKKFIQLNAGVDTLQRYIRNEAGKKIKLDHNNQQKEASITAKKFKEWLEHHQTQISPISNNPHHEEADIDATEHRADGMKKSDNDFSEEDVVNTNEATTSSATRTRTRTRTQRHHTPLLQKKSTSHHSTTHIKNELKTLDQIRKARQQKKKKKKTIHSKYKHQRHHSHLLMKSGAPSRAKILLK